MLYLNIAIIFSQIRSNVVEKEQLNRKENIKFAVGMIVTHIKPSLYRLFKKHHHGVIIGWHCKHTSISETREMYASHLRTCADYKNENIVDQPYYIILSENNRICYWQQGMNICSIFMNNM